MMKSLPVSMMLLFPPFPLLFITLLLFLFMVIKKKQYNKPAKLPPGPPKLPLIGNLHQLISGSSTLPHHFLRNLAQKYGPIMSLKLGEVSAIVISSPEGAEEVLKTQELNFAQRPITLVFTVLGYGDSGLVFPPYGKCWRQRRKICTMEVLSAKRVQSFRSLREEEVLKLIESISSCAGNPINFTEKIFKLTTNITSRAAFGNECKDVDAFIEVLREGGELGGGFDLPDLFPSLKFLHYFSRMKRKLEKLHQRLDKILDHIIEDHKAKRSINDTSVDEDLVDVLLNLQESNDLEYPITATNIKAIIWEVFGGGTDTSATTIEWAMSELLRNPKIMEKAQAEVRQVLKGKKKIIEEDIQELNYLQSIIKETLRLHPPAPLAPREAVQTCELEDGYEIPMKSKVIMNLWAIGRNPKYWDDADCFRPERFHGSFINYKGTNFEYIPFGAGRRICPGIYFAIASVEVALALLLYHFDWKLPDETKAEELDMTEVFGATVKRKHDLYVTATKVFSPFDL